jgi:pimeloyl-ACP methyl ester carboxylesterase
MAFVLIHGGAHGAWCWDPLIPLLDGSALAVDLPGRGRNPGDLEKLTLRDFAASVALDIESHGLSRVILVGHSMAGVTIPRVLDQLPERIASVVFVSCVIPREGESVFTAMGMGPAQATPRALDPDTARHMFCNDMDESQTRFVLEHLTPEAPGVMSEPVTLAGLRRAVPRTYVKLLRDQALSLAQQERSIASAGPGCDVIELDAGHNAMISQPRALAAILNGIARRIR